MCLGKKNLYFSCVSGDSLDFVKISQNSAQFLLELSDSLLCILEAGDHRLRLCLTDTVLFHRKHRQLLIGQSVSTRWSTIRDHNSVCKIFLYIIFNIWKIVCLFLFQKNYEKLIDASEKTDFAEKLNMYNSIARTTISVYTFQLLSQFMTLLEWLRQSIDDIFFAQVLPYCRSRSSGSAGFMNSLLSQGGAPWVKEDLTSPAEGFCPNTDHWLRVICGL